MFLLQQPYKYLKLVNWFIGSMQGTFREHTGKSCQENIIYIRGSTDGANRIVLQNEKTSKNEKTRQRQRAKMAHFI